MYSTEIFFSFAFFTPTTIATNFGSGYKVHQTLESVLVPCMRALSLCFVTVGSALTPSWSPLVNDEAELWLHPFRILRSLVVLTCLLHVSTMAGSLESFLSLHSIFNCPPSRPCARWWENEREGTRTASSIEFLWLLRKFLMSSMVCLWSEGLPSFLCALREFSMRWIDSLHGEGGGVKRTSSCDNFFSRWSIVACVCEHIKTNRQCCKHPWFECWKKEHKCQDPKDGEQCLSKTKAGENSGGAHSDTDVTIVRYIWCTSERLIEPPGSCVFVCVLLPCPSVSVCVCPSPPFNCT